VPGGVAALVFVVGLAVVGSPGLGPFSDGRDLVNLGGAADRAGPALDERQAGAPDIINLDGQPATLRLGPFGWDALTFERQGTWIELSGTLGTRDRALQLASALLPTP